MATKRGHSRLFFEKSLGEELRSGHPVQYLHNMSHGQNLSSTAGEPEFVAQQFFEIPALCWAWLKESLVVWLILRFKKGRS
jgi:hypothetical protein